MIAQPAQLKITRKPILRSRIPREKKSNSQPSSQVKNIDLIGVTEKMAKITN